MNQTDGPEIERALRAATCVYCKAGLRLHPHDKVHWREPSNWNVRHLKYGLDDLANPCCTSKHDELLPLFQQTVERAKTEIFDWFWDAAALKGISSGRFSPSGLLDAVEKQAVAGAYVAAAKHPVHFMFDVAMGCYSSATCGCGKEFDTENTCAEWTAHILALTPAEARQATNSTGAGVAVGAELRTFKTAPVERPDSRDGVPFISEELDKKYSQVELAAAISSAEARARLEEAKWWYDRDARISYCRSSLHVPSGCERCMRIAELEAEARTPDSTKEQG